MFSEMRPDSAQNMANTHNSSIKVTHGAKAYKKSTLISGFHGII